MFNQLFTEIKEDLKELQVRALEKEFNVAEHI